MDLFCIVIGIVFGIMSQFSFFWGSWGIWEFFFVAFFWLAIFWLAYKEHYTLNYTQHFKLFMILFFAFMVWVYTTPTIIFFNSMSVLVLSAYLFWSFFLKDKEIHTIGTLISTPFMMASMGTEPYKNISRKQDVEKLQKLAKWLTWFFLALPLLALFTILLYSGDLVFQNSLDWLGNILTLPEIDFVLIWKIIIFFFVTLSVTWACYHIAIHNTEAWKGKAFTIKEGTWGNIQTGSFLSSLTILFWIYIFLQVGYFILGDLVISKLDFTYAEYAKKWYYELWIITLITYIVVILVYRDVIKDELGRINRILVWILWGISWEIIVMTFFSMQRLSLYAEAYGFTELRVWGFALLWILIGVFLLYSWQLKKPLSVRKYYEIWAIIVLGILGILNFSNLDGFIANKNIERFTQSKLPLDAEYIVFNLSDDAIPSIVKWVQQMDKNSPEYKSLLENLNKRKLERNFQKTPWYHFQYQAYQAERSLNDFYTNLRKK